MTNSILEMPARRCGIWGGVGQGGNLCEDIFQQPENECLESKRKDEHKIGIFWSLPPRGEEQTHQRGGDGPEGSLRPRKVPPSGTSTTAFNQAEKYHVTEEQLLSSGRSLRLSHLHSKSSYPPEDEHSSKRSSNPTQ